LLNHFLLWQRAFTFLRSPVIIDETFMSDEVRALKKTSPDQEFNHLCKGCLRPCKQQPSALVLSCPRYLPPPFKVEQPRYQQLDLFTGKKS